MNKKTILFLNVTLVCTLRAQNEWTLRPWVQVEGKTNGEKLGNFVEGISSSPNIPFRAAIATTNNLAFYSLQTNTDTTVQRIFWGNHMLRGDINNDGYDDVVIRKTTNDFDTVFVFYGTATGIDTLNRLVIPGENRYDRLKATTIGDVDNDGKQDLVLTAANYPNLLSYGKVYIYLNPVVKALPEYSFLGDTISALLGVNAAVGDINNDGLNDLVVKGYHSTGSQENRYNYLNIYLAQAAGSLDTIKDMQWRSGYYNSPALSVSDVNGDGAIDLIWTCPDTAGSIYVHYGKSEIDSLPNLKLKHPGIEVGASVANAGDMNNDGYDDIVVGVPNQTFDFGFVMIYAGGPNVDEKFDAGAGLSVPSLFGESISSLGDINGDGLDDILVGAPRYQWDEYRGKWFILLGDTNIAVTAVEEPQDGQPASFELLQNYPNPFNASTVISYKLSARSHVTLIVYDLLGKEVARLFTGEDQRAGSHSVSFDASGLSSGTYFYKLTARTPAGLIQTQTNNMTVLK